MATNPTYWEIKDRSTQDVRLYLKDESYPIGRKKWTDPLSNKSFLLSFDVCTNDEFNCENGRCIPMTERCNRKNECNDNSDEMDCEIHILPPDYNKNIYALGKMINNTEGSIMYMFLVRTQTSDTN